MNSYPPDCRRKPPYSAAKAFFTTTALFGLIGLWVALNEWGHNAPSTNKIQKRAFENLNDGSDCHLVHHAENQCAYVRQHCPDEQAGIFAYLELYYCDLSYAQPLAAIILVLWLGLLFSTIGIAASDFFCVNLSTISNMLHMSENLAGVTFLAFGNGSPDVFSTFAAMNSNSGSLAVGELIGAAGFITAVVAGSMAIVRPFKVRRAEFVRDVIFFLIAAAFSMTFLYDGKLYFWECVTMIGVYIFYVIAVLVWHWWFGQRKKRRSAEAVARAHFALPGQEEAEVFERYRDEDDDAGHDDQEATDQRSRASSIDPLSALEQGRSREREMSPDSHWEEMDEEDRERFLGEINSNMRLNRPRMRARSSTQRAIRPSLVGALEYSAVVASLRKASTRPLPLASRRHSNDGNLSTTSDHPQDPHSTASTGHLLAPQERPSARIRAVSVNDADRSQAWDRRPKLQSNQIPSVDLLEPLNEQDPEGDLPNAQQTHERSVASSRAHSRHSSRSASPSLHGGSQYSDRLAPPNTTGDSLRLPRLDIPRPGSSVSSGSPVAPFPAYTDDFTHSPIPVSGPPSLHLPPPSQTPSDLHDHDHFFGEEEEDRPLSWWPYDYLPGPRLIVSTFFPTLSNWKSKNWWEKLLGIVACPSVFLLNLTLPVVEKEADEEENDDLQVPDLTISPPRPSDQSRSGESPYRDEAPLQQQQQTSSAEQETAGPSHVGEDRSTDYAAALSKGTSGHGPAQGHSAIATVSPHSASPERSGPSRRSSPRQQEVPQPWNRWHLIVQVFTAPFFMVLIYWANADAPVSVLGKMTLISVLVSLVLLLLLLFFSTPQRKPRWRPFLCFAGFLVSIAWISSIANEVVGVLKALGVIVDISDAILGLTIFAVGNSCGDLVADITVAQLGFPVMALAACFGGPMLNILLGIGISGCWITLRGAATKPHVDLIGAADIDVTKFKPYHIVVGRSLIISGITLLVTLTGLLVAVPARKWRMDRWVGWGLVALWVASTIGNVVLEAVSRGGGSEG